MEVFDFVKSLTNTKEDLLTDETESAYVPFIVNRALSYYADCIFHAQELNKYNAPKRMHYRYLMESIPRRKRFAPWAKFKVDPVVEVLQRVYNYSLPRAIETAKILSETQKKEFIEQHNLGGKA